MRRWFHKSWPVARLQMSPSDERATYRAVLFWAFVSTFVGTVSVTIFAIYHQVNNPKENIPYLGMLITAVLLETAAALFAYWKTLTSPEPPLVSGVPNKEDHVVVEGLILNYVSRELEHNNVAGAVRIFEELRRAGLSFATDRILVSELGVRRLVGHGHTIRTHFPSISSDQYKSMFSYEMALLAYANKEEQRIVPPIDPSNMDQISRSLWLSLLAIESVSFDERRKARNYFASINHRWDQCRDSISTETDLYVAYASVSNAITAAYLGETEALEGYLDVAKLLKANVARVSEIAPHEHSWGTYPQIAILANLYFSFVMVVLGRSDRDITTSLYIRAIPGPSKILARHCRVLAMSTPSLSAIEGLTKGYDRPVSAFNLAQRLRTFERKLLSNSVNVISGVTGETTTA
jgi:hypothetical protein